MSDPWAIDADEEVDADEDKNVDKDSLFANPSTDPWEIDAAEKEIDPDEEEEEESNEELEQVTDNNTIIATFVDGPIGVKFNHEGEVIHIKQGTQAERVKGLSKDDILISVADTSTSGLSLKQIMQIVQREPRPITFVFERHTNWTRNQNGLPDVDQEMLNILFHTFDTANSGSLDAEGFAGFMKEVHDMAVAYTGREPEELEGAYDHAQDLIDAHDSDDDGRLDFDELKEWLEKSLRMGQEERKAYSERGGYCPDSVRFVEDVAHGLHISTEAAAEKEEAAFNARLPKNIQKSIVQEEVDDEAEDEEAEDEEQEEEAEQEEQEEQEEQNDLQEEELEDNEIIPKQKNSLKAIEILPGLSGVAEMIESKGPHVNRMVVRGCLALSSGSFMKHLEMSEEVICFAITSLLNAEDNVMRSAILEACLNRATIDDLDENELLDSEYVHLSRARVVELVDRMKLEDVDLAHDLKLEADMCHSEKTRFVNLVKITEALAEPREFELMEMQGISRTVDEKHRYALTATIDRLSLTLEEERITAVKQAILEAVTWAQLAEVLEGVIANKPQDALMEAAVGDGLVCRNRPRLTMLREHVRCSDMMPHSPAVYQSVESKLENALTSYDLVDVLMLILNRFGESLVHLNETRDQEDTAKPFKGYVGSSKFNRNSEADKREDVQRELTELRQAQRDEHDQLSQLLSGNMTAAQFKGGSNRAPSPPSNSGQRAIGIRNWDSGRSGKNNGNKLSSSSKPLQALNSSTRASISTMFKTIKGIQSNPLNIQAGLLSRAMQVLERVCVTIAGASKVLLITFHPRLSNVDKAQNFESAGLASAATDTDDLQEGERRLLRSIVKLYMGTKHDSNDAAAAHRAVDSATTKRDIIEILQVMIISTGRSELPPVKGAAGYVGTPPNSKKSQRRVDPNSGRKSRADRAAARGNDFFEGDYDKDDVLVDGRPKTGPTNQDENENEDITGTNTNNNTEGNEDKDDNNNYNNKQNMLEEFNVMQRLPRSVRNGVLQPSPPPRAPGTKKGPRVRVRGPKGLSYVKSLNKTRPPGPPSALRSYQGTQTLWTDE